MVTMLFYFKGNNGVPLKLTRKAGRDQDNLINTLRSYKEFECWGYGQQPTYNPQLKMHL